MKRISVLIIFLLIRFYGLSTNKMQNDSIVYLNECIAIQKNIYSILDTAINHELKFFRRNCTFEISLYKELGKTKLSIGVLDEELLKYYDNRLFGYFNYRGSLFIVCSDPKLNMKFFKRVCKSKKQFIFKYFNGEMMPLIEETGWFYFYKKGQFVFDYLFDAK